MGRRLIAGGPVGVEVPADGLGPEDVAFEAELGLAHRDLFLVVEPGGGDVPLSGEDEHLDHGKAAADGVLVEQTRRGDRAVVRVGTEHHQRAARPERLPEWLADVEELPVRAATAYGLEDSFKRGLPTGTTRRGRLVHE